MPTDYYADAAAPAATAEPEVKEPAEPKEEASDSQTAELPKAVLGGKDFKPGEEVVLQVVQVMEDSVLVKYATEEKKPEEEEEAPPEEPAPAPVPGGGGGQMNSMYS